jgi:hypothetical protein
MKNADRLALVCIFFCHLDGRLLEPGCKLQVTGCMVEFFTSYIVPLISSLNSYLVPRTSLYSPCRP